MPSPQASAIDECSAAQTSAERIASCIGRVVMKDNAHRIGGIISVSTTGLKITNNTNSVICSDCDCGGGNCGVTSSGLVKVAITLITPNEITSDGTRLVSHIRTMYAKVERPGLNYAAGGGIG